MLFQVKTTYRCVVDASSKQEAYRQVYDQMKKEPGNFLAGVEVHEEKNKHGLLYRLVFGY